jgi:hypothetical protein
LSTPISLGEALWTAEATGLAFKEPRRVWFAPVGHTDEHTLRTRLGPLPPGWNATEFEGLLVILAGPADQLPEAHAPAGAHPPPLRTVPVADAQTVGAQSVGAQSVGAQSVGAQSVGAQDAKPALGGQNPHETAEQSAPAPAARFGWAAIVTSLLSWAQPTAIALAAANGIEFPPWHQALPPLDTVADSQLRTRLALESGLAVLLAWTALDGHATISRWYSLRSNPDWKGAQAAFKGECLLDRGRRGKALTQAWQRIDAQATDRARLAELRGLLDGFALRGVALSNFCVSIDGVLALLWDAHPRRGAVRLLDGKGAALPAALVPRLDLEWLRAGLQLQGIDRTHARGDAVVGTRADSRDVVIALRVAALAASPRALPELALHLGWIQQHQVPLIALTDGEGWRWLRREGQRGLLELVGHPADFLSS